MEANKDCHIKNTAWIILVVVSLLLTRSVQAATYTATVSQDNMIHSGAPTVNFGTHNVFDVSTIRKFLQRFDLSSIPSSATCTSAYLYYYKVSAVPNRSLTCTLYSISKANSSWAAGATYGGTAKTGESCWNALAANGSGGVSVAWTGSAGLSTSGTDYEPTPIGSFTIPANAQVGDPYQVPLNCSRIQGWFGSPNTNYGSVMTCTDMAEYIGSNENATPGYRPRLIVNYIEGGTVPSSTPTRTPPSPTPSISTVKPGDANGDNRVDGLDYVIWLNHYGGTSFGVTSGDYNTDNRVDGLDYVVWLNNYGS